jgi:hypothetical protein
VTAHPLLALIVTLVVGVVGGAGLWNFAAKWLELRERREETEVGRLRNDVEAVKKAHQACERNLEGLALRLEAVEHHHSSYLPRWIKDARKRIVWINSAALVAIFGRVGYTRTDVIGRTFAELLDVEAAREIDGLDRLALALPGQAVSTLLALHPQLPLMVIVKVAGSGRDGEIIFEGYAYRQNPPDIDVARGERRQEEQVGASMLRMAGPDAGEAGDPAR